MKCTNFKKGNLFYKIVLILFVFFQISYLFLIQLPQRFQVHATLTSAKDTLSNSRLSFRAKVNSGSSGTAVFTIQSGQADADTQNLFPRDTVCFGDSLTAPNGCIGSVSYTVATIPTYNGTTVELTSALGTAMTSSDIVVATQSATHTITFTTANAVNNPIIKVLIPAVGSGNTAKDGFADYGASATAGTSGFDANAMGNSDVTCTGTGPTWTPTFVTSVTSGDNYHRAVCTGSGTLAASTAVTIVIGVTNKLINPAPVTSGHSRGTADVYNVTINEYDSGGTNVVDSTIVSIAPVEGVLVSATVQNTLSFSIAAVSSGTPCGKALSVTTTATTVPFGTITSGAFYNAAHLLTVSTNAASGYSVTAQENAALSIDGLSVTTLADTACPPNTCTTTSQADWTTTSTSGFGYSLANSSGTDASFLYNTSATFNARPFDSSTARTIMTNTAPVNGSAVNVCYQIATSGTQKAGYYLNKLTYIATPTF